MKTPKNSTYGSVHNEPKTYLEELNALHEAVDGLTEQTEQVSEDLNGKVNKDGDTMTGDLTVPNVKVDSTATVGTLNSTKLNQKYEGAIKAELHVDEHGISEFVNAGDTGRFETTRVITPTEEKTEIYDNQESKRMSFRLPYLEASAGNHRLLTEEDLGGGGSSILEDIEDEDGHKRFVDYAGVSLLTSEYITNMFAIASLCGNTINFVCLYRKQANVTIPAGSYLCEFEIPQWIYEKIIINEPDSNIVNVTSSRIWSDGDNPATGGYAIHIIKTDGKIKFRLALSDTQSSMRNTRIEFLVNLGV